MKNKLLFLIYICLPFCSNAQNEKVTYFLHGLGGVQEQWDPVAAYYEDNFKMKSVTTDFASSHIDVAATVVNTQMTTWDYYNDQNGILKENNILIAQSLGGLVGRSLDRKYVNVLGESNRRFGGLVTVGTAHSGARILNNATSIAPWAAEGCADLSEGYIVEITNNIENSLSNAIPWYVKIFSWTSGPFVGAGTQAIDNILSNIDLTQSALGISEDVCAGLQFSIPILFADYLSPIGQQHAVGTSYLFYLNNYFTHNIPIVAVHSTESQDDAFWRIIASFRDQVPQDTIVFQAADNKGDSIRNDLHAPYLQKQSQYSTNSEEYWAFRAGSLWVSNANDTWLDLIGARITTVTQNGGICECNEEGGPVGSFYWTATQSACFSSCAAGYATWDPITSTTYTYKNSDGVVLQESANGASITGTKKYDYPIFFANHLEMRNHSETKRVLDDLFEDTTFFYDNGFFKVGKR